MPHKNIKALPFNDEVSEQYLWVSEENIEDTMWYLHSRTENYRNILQTHLVLWFLQNNHWIPWKKCSEYPDGHKDVIYLSSVMHLHLQVNEQ